MSGQSEIDFDAFAEPGPEPAFFDAFADPEPVQLAELPPLKPHQERGLAALQAQRAKEPELPCLVVAPPGAGKSRLMIELTKIELAGSGSVMIKAHRKMLLEQLQRGFGAAGIEFGVIADGYPLDLDKRVQIASTATLFSRGVRSSKVGLPPASLLIDDEAHQQTGKMQRALVYGSLGPQGSQPGYADMGAYVVGFTGTPLMGASIYQRLVETGSYSELRECQMHQKVKVFSPDEIDTKGLRANSSGEFSEKAISERVQVIFGSVYDEWKALNPSAYPALLYAPSVPSSRWFAHQFMQRGVKVAHIDGESCLLPEGNKLVTYPSDRATRQSLLSMSQSGEIAMVCNRFVLREAIDMPWLYHGIFATVMGSLTTYLQSVGRLQRFCPNYNYKILQCHGGSYWRHGSPNEDREWRLGVSAAQALKERVEAVQRGEKQEGIRCPRCGCWRLSGPVCGNEKCRHRHIQSVRAVRSLSGRLKLMQGRVYKKPAQANAAEQLWKSMLFRAAAKNQSVSSAVKRAADEAAQKGIKLDFPSLQNAPPAPDTAAWNLPVRTVYPWTMRRKKNG